MIRANCRSRFTADDFAFITATLSKGPQNRVALTELLTDEDVRDQILDHELLFSAIVRNSGLSNISPFLYFYVLTRKAFLEHKIPDRDMADYVACMLAEFCSTKRAHTISKYHQKLYHYLTDLMCDFIDASSYEAFLMRSHVGNYALFMTGIFPDYVYRKATYGRRAPGFDYYEKMGSNSYRWAAQHKLATKYSLVQTLSNLAEQFRYVRIALNRLADDYIALDKQGERMDKMLRQIFFGNPNKRTDS
ncbi:MAG: hypothetical protein ACE5HO_19110 [bacterium]